MMSNDSFYPYGVAILDYFNGNDSAFSAVNLVLFN